MDNLAGFSFATRGRACLNCDGDLGADRASLFCPNCEPVFPKKHTAMVFYAPDAHIPAASNLIKVYELDDGEIAYAQPWTLFFEDRELRVYAYYLVSRVPGTTYSVRIKRNNDLILIDDESMKSLSKIGAAPSKKAASFPGQVGTF